MIKTYFGTNLNKGRIFLFLISLFLAFAFSCQRDETIYEPETDSGNQTLLKNGQIPGEYTGTYSGGEWLIALPDNWNSLEKRYMIFYAHGMVDPFPYEPVQLPDDIIGGKSIKDIVKGMNMAYTATSYRDNGLVVLDAVEDMKGLVDVVKSFFATEHPEYLPPDYLFLGGPSEGGLVTVLTIEKYPKLFDGAVSICGPIGSFYNQLQYNGDFHVLFNYFFGADLKAQGIDIGDPRGINNPALMAAWKSGALPLAIQGILANNPGKVLELIKCANVTVDVNDQIAVGTAILDLLRFNIMLTDDVISRMGGVPFNNKLKWYSGSSNDWLLNRKVQRILEPSYYVAKKNVKKYETSGDISVPVVTIHTTGDHVIPFWHNPVYRLKVFSNGDGLLHTGIPVVNYGHCTIEESHVAAALAIIIVKSALIDQFEITAGTFDSPQELNTFKQILQDNSIKVHVK